MKASKMKASNQYTQEDNDQIRAAHDEFLTTMEMNATVN
jgi:hypothetical protein